MIKDFDYTDDQIIELLNGIYDGSITEYAIDKGLYEATANYLKKGLYEGFGGTIVDFVGEELSVLTEMRENIYMFSAAKSFQQIKDIRSIMFDDAGKLLPKNQFFKKAESTFEQWNDAWGRTEYNTAHGQAVMGKQWVKIESEKDILPILTFSTNNKPCDKCAPYNGFSAYVWDKVWTWLTPLLHFNCGCIVIQNEESHGVSSIKEHQKIAKLKDNIPELFQMNPGIDKYVFDPKTNPYFKVEKKDIEFAKSNFHLPIPNKD